MFLKLPFTSNNSKQVQLIYLTKKGFSGEMAGVLAFYSQKVADLIFSEGFSMWLEPKSLLEMVGFIQEWLKKGIKMGKYLKQNKEKGISHWHKSEFINFEESENTLCKHIFVVTALVDLFNSKYYAML